MKIKSNNQQHHHQQQRQQQPWQQSQVRFESFKCTMMLCECWDALRFSNCDDITESSSIRWKTTTGNERKKSKKSIRIDPSVFLTAKHQKSNIIVRVYGWAHHAHAITLFAKSVLIREPRRKEKWTGWVERTYMVSHFHRYEWASVRASIRKVACKWLMKNVKSAISMFVPFLWANIKKERARESESGNKQFGWRAEAE